MSIRSKSVLLIQLGRRFDTCKSTWIVLYAKGEKAMKSSQNYLLSKLVHVDEFTVVEKDKVTR